MEISKLKTLTTPSLNDVLPILDINGGVSGKPILRKISLQGIFSLIEFPSDNGSNSSGFVVPTIIKTIAESGDYFIGIDSTGTTYKITKANLLAGLSNDTGSSSTGNTGGVTLSFVSNGDANGLFYYLGRQKNTTAWSNPHGNGLTVSASAVDNGSVDQLCNRIGNDFWTPSVPNSWVSFYILSGKLNCRHYSIKSRETHTDYYPRNWKLQGSNDNSNWVDLDTQSNNAGLSSPAQWLSLPVTATNDYYSYFRILNTGVSSSNYYHLCLGEVELYGSYAP
ncbi:hypothetical protein KBT16_03355 [Nostoc sp. CCCryo 231-06]|nr:hypothetical protein [Nostoc sp. CCCryo 231-06]